MGERAIGRRVDLDRGRLAVQLDGENGTPGLTRPDSRHGADAAVLDAGLPAVLEAKDAVAGRQGEGPAFAIDAGGDFNVGAGEMTCFPESGPAQTVEGGDVDAPILDADDKHRTADGTSALVNALPDRDVVWLGTGPAQEALDEDPDAGWQHWDKVRRVLDKRDVILDLGANTVQRFLEYAIHMRVGTRWQEDGISTTVWVPTNADSSHLDSALRTATAAAAAFGAASVRVVLNRRDGGFDAFDGAPQGHGLAALRSAGVAIVTLPKGKIPPLGLAAMKRGPRCAPQVASWSIQEAAAALMLDTLVAERTKFDCEDWVREIDRQLAPLLPPKS